jgi:hypothetical protein
VAPRRGQHVDLAQRGSGRVLARGADSDRVGLQLLGAVRRLREEQVHPGVTTEDPAKHATGAVEADDRVLHGRRRTVGHGQQLRVPMAVVPEFVAEHGTQLGH